MHVAICEDIWLKYILNNGIFVDILDTYPFWDNFDGDFAQSAWSINQSY